MSFGWDSDFPVDIGGSGSDFELMLQALVAGVGKGHAADEDGVEWRWRECQAEALSFAYNLAEGALAQFYPSSATAGLAYYRELFNLHGRSDQDVRDRASSLMLTQGLGGVPGLLERLKAIDNDFEIDELPWGQCITTIQGRAFEDWEGDAPFGFTNGRGETQFPNYSNALTVFIGLDTGDAAPTDVQLANVAEAEAMMNDDLPIWVDYIIGGRTGFILDESHLDWDRFDDT